LYIWDVAFYHYVCFHHIINPFQMNYFFQMASPMMRRYYDLASEK